MGCCSTFQCGIRYKIYVFNASTFVVGDGPDTAYLVVDFQSAGAWDPHPFIGRWLSRTQYKVRLCWPWWIALMIILPLTLWVPLWTLFPLVQIMLVKMVLNGFYWGIWSDTIGVNRWVSNSGSSEWVQPNTYYGLSFTDFAPAIVPDTAVAVNDARDFTFQILKFGLE